ncbi:hypothetical protein RV09_GL002368 [Enterococcus moraviensis]|nr:hypothetical protein RV09_GL002368 [Enterococcus moraviensis]
MSHDGKNFIQINLGEGSGDSQPTQIENNDGFISVDRSGTYDVSVDLDMKKVTETLKPEFQVSKITADDGSAELVVTAPETILGKVVTAGAGFKTGFANPAVADAPTVDGEIRFLSSMIQSDGGSVIALDKSGNVYSRMISSNKWSSADWRQFARVDLAQMIKVTKDTGAQVVTAGGNVTLLQTILGQGIGFRAISAAPSATDNPTNQALRGTALMNSSTSGNFIGLSEDGIHYSRAISAGKWVGEWNKSGSTIDSVSDTQYWVSFNAAYTQINVSAIGDKTNRVLYLAGKYYAGGGRYEEEFDTTYWYIDFDLAKADIISNLVVYRDVNKKRIDYEYNLENDINIVKLKNKKILTYGGLTTTTNTEKVLGLSTNSLNLGTLSSDFSYFIIQSLNFFTIKLRVEGGFYFEPKKGSIVRTQNFKNRPQITRGLKESFAFDVAAKGDPGNGGGEYKNYTITGYYQMIKNTADDSYDFSLVLTGMFDWMADIPNTDNSILSDKNNVFSTSYVGKEYEFVVRQKTVFL